MKEPHPALRGLPLDHVAVAVNDLAEASRPYVALGLTRGTPETLPGQGVRLLMLGGPSGRIELLEPLSPETSVARFLARRGPGLHHVAFRVDSLDHEVDRLTAAGARFTEAAPRTGHGGSRVIFLHPGWTGGVLVELVERGGDGV